METITPSQVYELIKQLPPDKLQAAYRLLTRLSAGEAHTRSLAEEMLSLPVAERRRMLVNQARHMETYYRQTADERSDWQAGDFVET
jgi:hypothetical protein